MTQAEARQHLSRQIDNTIVARGRIIMLRTTVQVLLAGSVADSDAGKELTKIAGKTVGERFSIEKSLAERILKAIPLDEAGSVETDTKEPVEKTANTKSRPPKEKPAKNKPGKDEPPPAEDLDDDSKPEGPAEVL